METFDLRRKRDARPSATVLPYSLQNPGLEGWVDTFGVVLSERARIDRIVSDAELFAVCAAVSARRLSLIHI